MTLRRSSGSACSSSALVPGILPDGAAIRAGRQGTRHQCLRFAGICGLSQLPQRSTAPARLHEASCSFVWERGHVPPPVAAGFAMLTRSARQRHIAAFRLPALREQPVAQAAPGPGTQTRRWRGFDSPPARRSATSNSAAMPGVPTLRWPFRAGAAERPTQHRRLHFASATTIVSARGSASPRAGAGELHRQCFASVSRRAAAQILVSARLRIALG